MDFCAEVQRLRHAIADPALLIARELEAGRATAPFQDKFSQLSGDPVLPVRAAVISSQPEALHALLSEIIGHDYNVCKIVVPSRLGFSEVLLQERGFLLDTGNGPQEFDDSGSFLSALQKTHALQPDDDSSLEPLRLKLKGPTLLNGLCLLVPHSLDALQRKPALLSTLADQTDWVFLAGDPSTSFTAEQRTTIQLILDHVTGLQHVLQPAPEGTPPPAQAEEWWRNWKVALSLGLVRTGTELLRTRLALLTTPTSELRQYLVESRLLRQLDMTLALMDEETKQAQRQLGNRLNLAKEGLVAAPAATDARKSGEAIRTKLGEEFENLLRANERETKSALAPDGEISRRLLADSRQVTSDDIEQTLVEVSIKLTLGEHVSHKLAETLADIGHTRLALDLQQLREGLECSVRDAEKSLEAATGFRHKLAATLPDETEIRTALGTVVRPEIRYRSEMPRPTLGTRFNAARQAIMGMMIAGTILGGVATLTGEGASGSNNIRTTLSALMLPLLIIGFLWTYVSFRKKERLTLEKEVDKLHDGVHSELRRLVQELLREQHTALGQALQKSLRSLQQQIDAIFAQNEQQRSRDAEQQRKRSGEQQRSLEQRLTRLRDFDRQFTALQSRLADARKIQKQWLAAWIERFNQGKV